MANHAELVKISLEDIAKANAGRLTPDAVVAAAADPSHILHESFTWDDEKAAHQHRLDQARALIKSVRVQIQTESRVISTVFYVRDPDASADEQGYVSIAKLRTDADMARAALIQEFQRAAVLLQGARDLAAALDMREDVDGLIETIGTLKQQVEIGASTAQ